MTLLSIDILSTVDHVAPGAVAREVCHWHGSTAHMNYETVHK